jgi:hypothetical protein
LRLNDVERTHLGNLVRPTGTRPTPVPVRQTVLTLLDLLDNVPAFVLGRRADVLAYNRLADAVCGFGNRDERNIARQVFLNPDSHLFYPEWDVVTAETVAHLRLDAGRHPDDPKLAELVGELSIKSDTFRRLWSSHDVKEKTFGRKLIHHDLVGELELAWESMDVPGAVGQQLVTYIAEPGSATAEKIAVLASWTAKAQEPGRLSSRQS